MADLGAEDFSLSKLLTGAFQANPAWKDLADATTEVLTKNVESHRRKLARIRDTVQNRQGDLINDVYYTGGRVEDTAGDPIPLALNTRIPSAKILRIEQNNSARLELGIDYALIEFTLANGQPAYWRMPMNAPQERSILIDNAKMIGFDFFNTALSDEDYQRLNEYVSLYWPEGGTDNFIRFISFLKNISLEMAPLWSKDDGLDEFPILDARDPNDNERVPAYLGGEWYQTSHVELRYDPIRDVDPTETFEIQMAFYREIENLFYLFAPIILVLERIVATITLYWFVYVGTSAHLTEIWQEKLVIDPLPTISCDFYINTYEPINSDCLINIDDSCSVYINTNVELISNDNCLINLGDDIVECPEWANSELLANSDCPANPGEEIIPGCSPQLFPRFDPQSFVISTDTYDGMGAVHITSDTNPYLPGISTSWVGLKLYNEVSGEVDTYVFFNGAEVSGDYAFEVSSDNIVGTPSYAGLFGYPVSDLKGAPDGTFDAPLYGVITHSTSDFSGFAWNGTNLPETFENAGYATGREVVKVLVGDSARYVISVLDGTDIEIHTMPKLQNSIASTVTIFSGNVSEVAAEWHTLGDSIKIVYLDGDGGLLMTGIYHLTDETLHNLVHVDDTALDVQKYLNMSAWDGTAESMQGRYGVTYLGVNSDGSGALFYHELQPGYYPAWESTATTPEIVFSFDPMTETGYETESAEIPIAAAIVLGRQADTRMLFVVVRRWEYNAPDWEPLLYVVAYERADGAWVKSAIDLQLTFAGDSNVKNLDAIGDYLEARVVVDRSTASGFSDFLFTVVHERAMGSDRDFVGVPLAVVGCNTYIVVE